MVEIWPARKAGWLVDNGLLTPLPPYEDDCTAAARSDAPCIVSPEDGSVFELIENLPLEYQKICLHASVPSRDGAVHWFLDGRHLTAARTGEETYLVPTKGRHTLLCLDATGRSASTIFEVN